MPLPSFLLLVPGAVTAIYAAILLLIRAFKTSLAWGLIALFVPLGSVVFIFAHWGKGRRPFFAHLIALAFLGGFFCTLPSAARASVMQLVMHQYPNPARNDQARQSADFDAQITKAREDALRLQQEIASETTSLTGDYNDLAKRRGQLRPGDQPAIAAFNRDAAAYTARKTQLNALRVEAQKNDGTLSDLLDKRATLVAKAAAEGPKVTVYGTQWCPACKTAREYLNSKGVAYRDVDVEHSSEGAAEFEQRGGGGVPMIVINDQQATGFSSAWVDAHLQ
jgi:mycoredoxin